MNGNMRSKQASLVAARIYIVSEDNDYVEGEVMNVSQPTDLIDFKPNEAQAARD